MRKDGKSTNAIFGVTLVFILQEHIIGILQDFLKGLQYSNIGHGAGHSVMWMEPMRIRCVIFICIDVY